MSGGSFDYLYCFADDPEELGARFEQLEPMADALEDELGPGHPAVLATRRMWVAFRGAGGLREVWKAMEWFRSGDWGREPLLEAAKRYGEGFAMKSPPKSKPLDLTPIKARLETAQNELSTGAKLNLLAHAAEDIEALIAEVERLREETKP